MIAYRRAEAGDAEAIALLQTRSWRENYRGSFSDAFLDQALPEERLRVWAERFKERSPNQLVQLAHEGSQLVGFICAYGAHDRKWGSFIDNLHVAKQAKRTGIGTALLRETGAWLEQSHLGLGVYLWVLEANMPARRFYEHLGARNAGVVEMQTHGGAWVKSCRYSWLNPALLTARDPSITRA